MVGAAYVAGIMEGEFLKQYKRDDKQGLFEKTTFTIS